MTAVAWNIASGSDLRFPAVEGPRPPMVRFFNWYMAKLQRAAQRDVAVAEAFVEAFTFRAPPSTLLAPSVAIRVLRGNLRHTEQDRLRYRAPLKPVGQRSDRPGVADATAAAR